MPYYYLDRVVLSYELECRGLYPTIAHKQLNETSFSANFSFFFFSLWFSWTPCQAQSYPSGLVRIYSFAGFWSTHHKFQSSTKFPYLGTFLHWPGLKFSQIQALFSIVSQILAAELCSTNSRKWQRTQQKAPHKYTFEFYWRNCPQFYGTPHFYTQRNWMQCTPKSVSNWGTWRTSERNLNQVCNVEPLWVDSGFLILRAWRPDYPAYPLRNGIAKIGFQVYSSGGRLCPGWISGKIRLFSLEHCAHIFSFRLGGHWCQRWRFYPLVSQWVRKI